MTAFSYDFQQNKEKVLVKECSNKRLRNRNVINSLFILAYALILGLEQLVSNSHLRNFPCNYKTGALALSVEQLKKLNSPEGRFMLGLELDPPGANLTSGGIFTKLVNRVKLAVYRKRLFKKLSTEFPDIELDISALSKSKKDLVR